MANVEVFISSTCYDLADARIELAAFLREHAFIVSLSDDYESSFVVNGRVDSIESCLQNVASAQVIVALIDRRYGPKLPEGHPQAGISATHAELNHAAGLKKPILMFVRDKSVDEAHLIVSLKGFKPRWIDGKDAGVMATTINNHKNLAKAVAAQRSNWFDTFRYVTDLKPLALKRLLDAFPTHVGAYARRPERMVRMYFSELSGGGSFAVNAELRNAGPGAALNLTYGHTSSPGTAAVTVVGTQGGVPPGGGVTTSPGAKGVWFGQHPNAHPMWIFCEYENALGDLYRVEHPLTVQGAGYKSAGPEILYVRVNGGWMKVLRRIGRDRAPVGVTSRAPLRATWGEEGRAGRSGCKNGATGVAIPLHPARPSTLPCTQLLPRVPLPRGGLHVAPAERLRSNRTRSDVSSPLADSHAETASCDTHDAALGQILLEVARERTPPIS